jgi:hypothetical protein
VADVNCKAATYVRHLGALARQISSIFPLVIVPRSQNPNEQTIGTQTKDEPPEGRHQIVGNPSVPGTQNGYLNNNPRDNRCGEKRQ